MNTNQFKTPLVAMLASLAMCIILATSKTIQADVVKTNTVSHYSNNDHHIIITGDTDQRLYIVDGKKFTFDELSDENKEKINNIENALNNLAIIMDIKSDEFDQWSEKMEVISEKMVEQSEVFIENMDDFDLDIDHEKMSEFSKKLDSARIKMEVNMKNLEKQMKLIETEMPKIDQSKINKLENLSYQYEGLLLKIAEDF